MKKITIEKGHENHARHYNIEHKDNIFYDSYKQAAECVDEIVNHTIDYHNMHETAGQIDEFRSYSNNIISFCARRGQGKTSSMLSLTNALHDLQRKKDRTLAYEDVFSEKVRGCKFFEIKPIDPTTMEYHCSFLQAFFSQIYHLWFSRYQKDQKDHPEYFGPNKVLQNKKEAVDNCFQEVLIQIVALKKGIENNAYGELDELSILFGGGDSFITKQKISDLVRTELEYEKLKDKLNRSEQVDFEDVDITDYFMVIQIDDADLNPSRSYEIIEDIRKYFMIPNLIVFMALHLGTLRNCIEQAFVNNYKTLLNHELRIDHMDRHKCREMAERYIEKFLPGIHQIHLPYIDDVMMDSNVLLKYQKESQQNTSETMRYDHYLIKFIYEKTGIILMPSDSYLHDLLPKRFRELTQFLKYFDDLESVITNNGKEGTLAWLVKYLFRHCSEVECETCSELRSCEYNKNINKRRLNLNRFTDYFMYHWCTVNLDKKQFDIVESINKASFSIKCRTAANLIQRYQDNLIKAAENVTSGTDRLDSFFKSRVVIPNDNNITYAEILSILSKIRHELVDEHNYQFTYAIEMCFTIGLYKSLYEHLEKKQFDRFNRLIDFFNGQVFVQESLFDNTIPITDSLVSLKLVKKLDEATGNKQQNGLTNKLDRYVAVRKVTDESSFIRVNNDIDLYTVHDGLTPKDIKWEFNPKADFMQLRLDTAMLNAISSDHLFKERGLDESILDSTSSILLLLCNYDMNHWITKYFRNYYKQNKGNEANLAESLDSAWINTISSYISDMFKEQDIESIGKDSILPKQEIALNLDIGKAIDYLDNDTSVDGKTSFLDKVSYHYDSGDPWDNMVYVGKPKKAMDLFEQKVVNNLKDILDNLKNHPEKTYLIDNMKIIINEIEEGFSEFIKNDDEYREGENIFFGNRIVNSATHFLTLVPAFKSFFTKLGSLVNCKLTEGEIQSSVEYVNTFIKLFELYYKKINSGSAEDFYEVADFLVEDFSNLSTDAIRERCNNLSANMIY